MTPTLSKNDYVQEKNLKLKERSEKKLNHLIILIKIKFKKSTKIVKYLLLLLFSSILKTFKHKPIFPPGARDCTADDIFLTDTLGARVLCFSRVRKDQRRRRIVECFLQNVGLVGVRC